MPVKWGFGGRGPVAIVTDGVNNSAKQFLSVSVITGGTNKNVSNNVKNFHFWRYHTTLIRTHFYPVQGSNIKNRISKAITPIILKVVEEYVIYQLPLNYVSKLHQR